MGVGVVAVDGGLVTAADHEGGSPEHDQGPQSGRFDGGKGADLVEGADGGPDVMGFHAVVVEDRGQRDSQFAHGPTVRQIAEVDDPVGQRQGAVG
jgi:hypothetical protein